jgi:putative membrane protein
MQETLVTAALALLLAAYLVAVQRLAARGRRWPPRRVLTWCVGLALLVVALLPPLAAHDEDFTVHMVQHLLIGMVAPVLLVLAAPLTLVLAVVPRRWGRGLVRLLRSRVLQVVSHPVTAAVLAVGGLALLYTTGLYQRAEESLLLHLLVHVHVLVAGYLFAAALIGIDPNPHRSGLRMRCAVLVLAGGAHNVLAKLLYAHGPAGWATGAQVMWYGGDATDVVLALVLFGQWYRQEGRRLAAPCQRRLRDPVAPARDERSPDAVP